VERENEDRSTDEIDEPTDEMVRVGCDMFQSYDARYEDIGDAVKRIWRAMRAAQPKNREDGGGNQAAIRKPTT
jgi:hypothetical protein